MIAHVAEANEDRGRVVVRLGDFAPSSKAAIAAAVHVAVAFRSEIEGLFIEDPDLFSACAHGSLREVGPAGRASSKLTASALGRDAEHFAIAVQRELSIAAAASSVKFSAHVVRDQTIPALQAACAQRGPWNIIVFAESIVGADKSELLSAAVSQVWGTTGYIATGARCAWRSGPIVVVIEDIDHLTGMIRAAERLAAVAGDPVYVLPVGGDEIALDWLEGEVRLTLGDASNLTILPRPAHAGSNLVLRSAIAQTKPRIIIARHGGVLLPLDGAARPLADLGCPVFLVH
ncbi:MAG: hypothetical protein ABL901_16320 [Hyphomicrobiaceae bacterium]